jgi:hypothetical protein
MQELEEYRICAGGCGQTFAINEFNGDVDEDGLFRCGCHLTDEQIEAEGQRCHQEIAAILLRQSWGIQQAE